MNAHEILGVEPDASRSEIKAAYRRLALLLHPDRLTDARGDDRGVAEQRMQELNDAYQEMLDALPKPSERPPSQPPPKYPPPKPKASANPAQAYPPPNQNEDYIPPPSYVPLSERWEQDRPKQKQSSASGWVPFALIGALVAFAVIGAVVASSTEDQEPSARPVPVASASDFGPDEDPEPRVTPEEPSPPMTSAPAPTTAVPVDPVSALTWNPNSFLCSPAMESTVDRVWQTSADSEQGSDGGPIYPADRMGLGLRNQYGWDAGQGYEGSVTATIINPEGQQDVLTTYVSGDQLAEVGYPADAYDMWSGVHTVVWTTESGDYLACGGFEVAKLSGE